MPRATQARELGTQKRKMMNERTGISVGGEVSGPGDEGLALVLAGGDGVCADGAHDGGVGEGGLRGDDRVGDEVVDAL